MKKKRIKSDKTSQRAFKITANVKTSVSQVLEELNASEVIVSYQHRNPKGLLVTCCVEN